MQLSPYIMIYRVLYVHCAFAQYFIDALSFYARFIGFAHDVHILFSRLSQPCENIGEYFRRLLMYLIKSLSTYYGCSVFL